MELKKDIKLKIPKEVTHVTEKLEEAGFEAYLVGGCVRDLLLDKMPKDWDITTNAKPDKIIGLFEKTVYENDYGTVGVCVPKVARAKEGIPKDSNVKPAVAEAMAGTHETTENSVSRDRITENKAKNENNVNPSDAEALSGKHETPEYEVIEVTPYRTEAKYSDFRHPDEVKFSDKLEDDLKRRDFTVNAMAYNSKGHLTDMFGGLKDIENKVLRTVGEPDDRFREDALRMLRAVRFSLQLDFSVSHETSESILKNADLIKKISAERIRDEFVKIIMSNNPSAGIVMLQRYGLLKYIIPELEEGIGCDQSGAHIYDVWEHLLYALEHAARQNWPLEIRLSALFHDIGKPRSRRIDPRYTNFSGPREKSPDHEKSANRESVKKYTFYGHEVIGARMAKKIMERLKFPKKEIDLVVTLIRNHMFFSDTEKITLSAVRRIITKVGKENIWLLMNIRECDRVGMKKKEAPYRLRKYFAMIEEALHDPISVGALKIDGNYLMNELHVKPGPRMGWILHALLEEVLDDPSKNTVEHLSELVKSLDMLPDDALRALGERGKEKKDELEEEVLEKLHAKHGVRK